jgi:predicted amidohydrolase
MHIATLRVDPDGIAVAYRKSFLGGDEADRFSAGDGAVALEVDGWRLGMGICKDSGVPEHIRDVAALDVDVYVAGLVHLPEELTVQDERGAMIARECDAYVAFASFAGPTGWGFSRTAGSSTIWSPSGVVLARADTEPGSVARAAVRHRSAA